MTASLPVWSTTKAILSYVWGKRWLALRYAALPVVILLLIDLGGILAGVDIEKNVWWQIVTGLLALLAYAPFTVTWFQSIALGEGEARTRPVFVLAHLEKNVILANIRVAAFVVVITLVMAIVAGGGAYAIWRAAPKAMETASVLIAPVVLYFWVMVLTRASVVVAYGAAGQPMGLREAFRITRPIAYRMTWIHIIVATVALVVALPFPVIMGFDGGKSISASIGLTLANTVGGILYLIFVTTLFGFVYRRLKETAAA
jgi:hypothetical protein